MECADSKFDEPRLECDGLFDHDTAREGLSAILYNRQCYDEGSKSFKLAQGQETVLQVLKKTVATFGDRRCAGKRKLLKVHHVEENGSTLEKLEYANEITWLTYTEYYRQMCAFSRGLRKVLGPDGTRGQRILIWAETKLEWMMAMLAALHQGLEVVTVYASLGAHGLACAIKETHARSIIVDAKLLPTLASILPQVPDVRHIIAIDDGHDMPEAGVEAVNFSFVQECGNEGELIEPTLEDVAVIMYTSGTSGNPKGVCLTHGNLASGMTAYEDWLKSAFDIDEASVYMAYLPLAHVMEFITEFATFKLGMTIGYGTPHTLTDSGVKLKRPESQGDVIIYQPTFMHMPSAIVDKVYHNVHRSFGTKSSLIQWLFSKAMASGKERFAMNQVGMSPFWQFVFGNRLKALFGGNLRLIVSGSTLLSQEARIFMQTVANCPVATGYGLTETTGVGSVQRVYDHTSGVGPPKIACCIRLADWADGNYLVADEKNPAIGMPRGEILIGGDSITHGYFVDSKNPDSEIVRLNAENIVELDGIRFFRTGDIGQITKSGCVVIIDRKKDLWKGPNGEYVALAKVEVAMKLSKYVDMCVCHGQFDAKFVLALLCVNEVMIKQFAANQNLPGEIGELCKNEAVIEEVTKSVVVSCKKQKLATFEIPHKFVLISDIWTPENGLLTPAMKLKRRVITEKYQDEIGAALQDG